MDVFLTAVLSPLFLSLVYMSLSGVIIGFCVLLIRHIADDKIPPTWKNALWVLMLIALLVPYRIPSAISVVPQAPIGDSVLVQESILNVPQPKPQISNTTPSTPTTSTNPQATVPTVTESQSIRMQLLPPQHALPCIWVLGTVIMLVYLLGGKLLLSYQIRTQNQCSYPNNELIYNCKKQISVSRDIPVLVQDYIETPAITGLFTPKILLPTYINEMQPEHVRYILLHEFSHYKRGDLYYNALLLLLQSIYWFNPIIWFLFRFVRQDLEVCNDQAVLRTVSQSNHKSYAFSMIEVLSKYNRIPLAPRLLCMVDDKKNMKRRIEMMQLGEKFKKNRIWIGVCCLALIGVLTGLFLTKPMEGDVSSSATSGQTASSDNTTEASNSGDLASDATNAPEQSASQGLEDTQVDPLPAPSSTVSPTSEATITTPSPEPTTIIMTIEGYQEEVSAKQYTKQGYSIAIPVNEWIESSENAWQAKNNSHVSFEILPLAEPDMATVATSYWGNPGDEITWINIPSRYFETNDGQAHILYYLGTDNTTYYYALAECQTEALEGYGVRMTYMMDSVIFNQADTGNSQGNIVSFSEGLNDTTYTVFDSYAIGANNNLDASFIIRDVACNEIQTIAYPTQFNQSWYNTYLENDGKTVRFLDVNFDGSLDFVGQLGGAETNQYYSVWLYQESTNQFIYSEEYSAQCNPVYNPQTQYYLSTNYNRGIPSYTLFHVENGHLAYLGSIEGTVSQNGSITYIQRMYGQLDATGTLTYREVQSETELTDESDLSPLWNGFYITLER